MTSQNLTTQRYVLENFAAQDRIALLALHRTTNEVLQRITTAETLSSPDFQAWLSYLNSQKHDLYLSMNTLKRGSRGRTKEDVDCIRHIFLDFDQNGDRAVEKLLARNDLPVPNYLVSTSPDKWQVIWKVEGFEKAAAEELERGLVRSTGADPSVVDVARVLRLPGFYNHKYHPAYLVTAEPRCDAIRGPDHFPKLAVDEPRVEQFPKASASRRRVTGFNLVSQSERDWAYAKRALGRGEPERRITEEIARYRVGEKHNPQDYAQRTVRQAARQLEQAGREQGGPAEDEKQR
jgi:RepB DNA-primase N-terminal domain